MIAFLSLEQRVTAIEIITIEVHPNFRNKGIGSLLLEFTLEFAKKQKSRAVTLHVEHTNQPALTLYKKFGFEIEAKIPHYYGKNRDAYFMIKKI